MTEPPAAEALEVSLMMPCLNEARTIARCVERCWNALGVLRVRGEVIVSDNGSRDDSVLLAQQAGARVVHAAVKGYGNACRAGLATATGTYIFKLDADGTYDPRDVGLFLERFGAGCEYVIGSRLRGNIQPGAMPWSHRYVGNPALSIAAQVLCRSGITDICCGLKGFRRDAYQRLNFTSAGMEFGPETTIRARQAGLLMAEVPINYAPDERQRGTNLNPWRDGVRDLIFIFRESVFFRRYT